MIDFTIPWTYGPKRIYLYQYICTQQLHIPLQQLFPADPRSEVTVEKPIFAKIVNF